MSTDPHQWQMAARHNKALGVALAAALFLSSASAALSASDQITVGGASIPVQALGGFVPAMAVYAANGGLASKSGTYQPIPGTSQYGLAVASVNPPKQLTVPANATVANICVEVAAIRYTPDGSTPTATRGTPVAAGSCFQLSLGNAGLSAVKFFAQSGSPTLDVDYFQ